MNIDKKALKGFVDEIEASRIRAKGETAHQSEIFKRAKKKGIDTQALRKVLQRRAMSEEDRENLDHLINTYEHALGAKKEAAEAMEAGMSAREASEKFDIPRAAMTTIARGSKNMFDEPLHDHETGEIVPEPERPVGQAAPFEVETPSERVIPEGTEPPPQAAPPAMAITDEQALAAMEESFQRLQALKRAAGLA